MFELPLPILDLTVNLLIGLTLSLIVGWYYAHFGQALTNRRALSTLLPVLTMTTALVIAIIKSSLALSLGLVGALSIVRFRTAVKEPEELLYLFLAIAIGLGTGAGQRMPVVIGTVLILGYLAVRGLLAAPPPIPALYLDLAMREESEHPIQQVETILRRHTPIADFRRFDAQEGMIRLTYRIRPSDSAELDRLTDDLRATLPVEEISLISYDPTLA